MYIDNAILIVTESIRYADGKVRTHCTAYLSTNQARLLRTNHGLNNYSWEN